MWHHQVCAGGNEAAGFAVAVRKAPKSLCSVAITPEVVLRGCQNLDGKERRYFPEVSSNVGVLSSDLVVMKS